MSGHPFLNKPALSQRRGIPIFVEKSPQAVSQDSYERYWEVVVRQLMLHYGDRMNFPYGFAPVSNFVLSVLEGRTLHQILEIGGGVGRLAGDVARRFSEAQLAMVDYSYNMLCSAQDLWLHSKKIELDGRHLGFGQTTLQGDLLPNLWLGQAKGEALPFQNDCMDAVFSSFFIDRASDLELALLEQWRVLKPGGFLIIVSPLNFQKKSQWEKYGQPEKLQFIFQSLGLKLLQFEPEIPCKEPLDGRGNYIYWKAAAWVLEKLEVPMIISRKS